MHIPFPQVFIIQYALEIIHIVMICPFIYTKNIIGIFISVSLAISFTIINVIVLVLSIKKWWNVPLYFSSDGIQKKGSECFLWENIDSIKIRFKLLSQYGYTFMIMTLEYAEGNKIVFDINGPVVKTIRKYCKSNRFLSKFETIINDELPCFSKYD